MNTLARLISFILHPLLMTTGLLGLLLYTLPSALYPINLESSKSFIMLIFLMTFVFPILIISFFRIFGTIRSFSMEERSDRIPVFFFTAFLYGFVTYLFITRSGVSMDDSLLKLLIIIDFLILIAAIITVFYKVSVHAMGIMGVLGILLPLNKVAENNSLVMPTIIVLVLAGLVMSARLQLNAHTPREVLTGSLIGFSIGFFGMIILY